MDRELKLELMHAEARQKLINDLMLWSEKSENGGEYCFSVNGCRMWLSHKEAQSVIVAIRTAINDKLYLLRQQAADKQTQTIKWEE